VNEQAELLHAICDDPDDDVVRLVYADWLEEHQQAERAEFIRLQIRLHQMSPNDPEREALREHESALLDQYGKGFLAEFPIWARNEVVFERGFVVELVLNAGHWFEQCATLIRLTPIQRLRLLRVMPPMWGFASCAELQHIRMLDLRNNRIPATGAERIVNSPHLSNLRGLDLSGNEFREEGIAMLSIAEHWDELESLDLSSNMISSQASLLLSAPRMKSLHSLRLGGNFLSDRGVIEMTRTPQLTRLRLLDLSGNGIRDRGAEALADSPFVSGLEQLDLSRNSIRNAGAVALARSRHLRRLEALTLWDCDIENEGADALRERFGDRVVF